MRALAAAGDRAGALAHERVHTALLRQELDVEPDEAVRAFAQALRAQPARVPPADAPVEVAPAERADVEPNAVVPNEVAPNEVAPNAAGPNAVGFVASDPGIRSRRAWPRLTLLAVIVPFVLAAALWSRWRGDQCGSAGPLDPARVVIVPFHVSGADASLGYLSEGMVDLLAAELTGDGGPAAVDPRTAISAWKRLTAKRRTATADDAVCVARALGVRHALIGSLTSLGGSRLVVSATVLDATTARREQATVTGTSDSLPALVGRLAAQLLVLEANVAEQHLAALGARTGPALRAYLDGRAVHRRGHDAEAVTQFARALDLDSTFALAALDLATATGMLQRLSACVNEVCRTFSTIPGYRDARPASDDRQFDRAVRLAWLGRASLSTRDLALLGALQGDHPGPSTAHEMLRAIEHASDVAPDNADTQYLVGLMLLYAGPTLDISDSRERATASFRQALALDSGYVAPLARLVDVAVSARDTAGTRRLGTLYLRRDSVGAAADYVRWRMAVGTGDERMHSALRARFDSLATETLKRILTVSQMDGVALEDADTAAALLVRRAADPLEKNLTLWNAHFLALNRGRPREAVRLLRLRRELEPTDYSYWQYTTLAWLLWDGDSAAAWTAMRARVARLAVDSLRTLSRVEAHGVRITIAQQAFWDVVTGDIAHAAVAARRVRRDHDQLADAIDALLATDARSVDAARLRARVDSVALQGCCVAVHWINLALERAYERAGLDSAALHAVRRGRWRFPPMFLSTYLREEGRLAARTGDRAGAVRAYRHYLALRSDPEPELRAEVARVQAELARLTATVPQKP